MKPQTPVAVALLSMAPHAVMGASSPIDRHAVVSRHDVVLTAFDERGLATGGPFPYFPANGGLLHAVAMMAAGWDGAPKVPAPGFPQDGSWTVRYEGLSPAP